MRRLRTPALRLSLVASPLLLFGCGDGRSENVERLTGILNAGQTEDAAQCEAAVLNESEMSDDGVLRVALGVASNTAMEDDFNLEEIASDLSADDQDAFRRIAQEFADCMD